MSAANPRNNMNATRFALRWVIMTGLTALFIAVAARADENTVMLKTEAYVKGPMVYLGDIADIRGANADQLATLEISSAASPGGSKRIDSALLKMRLNGAGVDGVEVSGSPSVLAKTLSLDVSREVLTDDLRTFIQTELPWQDAETSIDIVDAPNAVVVPDGNVAVRWLPSPNYRWIGHGTFRGEIEVDGQVKQTVFAKANIEAYAEVLVCATDIPRGKPIQATDLRFEKRALSQHKGEAIQRLEEVEGMVSRDNMLMGEVLSRRSLVPRQLVKRNEMVAVETRVGSLVVRSRARAMDNAAAGDIVRLTNPQTKAEFQGVVRKDGVVVVE